MVVGVLTPNAAMSVLLKNVFDLTVFPLSSQHIDPARWDVYITGHASFTRLKCSSEPIFLSTDAESFRTCYIGSKRQHGE